MITLGGMIDRWARVAPDAPALAARDRPDMSYLRLAVLTDRIAAQLQHAGFRSGSRLAVVHRGGAEALATMLGVVKRAVAVPMSSDYSASECAAHLEACGVDAVVVGAALDAPIRDVARERGLRIIEAHDAPGAAGGVVVDLPAPPDPRVADPPCANDLAFVFGTSGTTRAAKRVPLRHRHMVSRSESTALLHELTRSDRCLNQNRLFLCSGISNSCTTLFAGGCVVHPDESRRFDLRAFVDGLTTLRPTWYVASYNFHLAVHRALESDASAVAGHDLRFIRVTSGHLDPGIVTDLEQIFGVPVIEAYSSTESGRICGNPLPPRRRKPGSVGIVSAGSEVSIVDDQGRPAKQGEPGEVVVRGAHVFDGYDGDASATAAAFFDDWYRTGDVGVFDEDGYLRLVGRIKEMINRGGQKISPVDIDHALMAHPGVADAAAFGVPHPMLGEVIAAAVVTAPDATLSERDIMAFLRERIEPIKIPRTFLFVEHIPRTASGKVRRSELVERFAAAGANAGSHRPDAAAEMTTPTEARLAQLWQWLLQKDKLGRDDDFFLLGGDSLMATQLVLAVNEVFDVELGLELVFDEASTIGRMAAAIEARRGLPKTGRTPDLPVVAIDERIARKARVRDKEIDALFVLDKATGLRRMRPGARFAAVAANAQGYRSPDIAPRKPAGTVRCAFLGDSFVFGSWSGGNETTWPFHAIETLRRAHPGAAYDYVNAAMPGHGIGHVTVQFRDSIAPLRPDVVVLAPGAGASAAEWARTRMGYSGVHYSPSWFGRRSGLCEVIEKNLVIVMRQLRAFSDRGKLKLAPAELRELSKEFERKLRDVVTECQRSGALVVLLTRESRIQRATSRLTQIRASGSRLFYQPYMSIGALLDVKDEFNRVHREVAAQSGALLVDVVGALPATGAYFEDSSHLTPRANAIVGELVARALDQDPRFQRMVRGALPAEADVLAMTR